MWVIWTFVGLYGLGFLITFAHFLRTARPGAEARAKQAVAAIGWPAYWGLVHGPAGTARFAFAVARFALRLPLRAVRFVPRPVLWVLGRIAAAIATAIRRSVPVRYALNYAACRRAGLSRRRTVAFAWMLLQTR